MGGRRVFKNQRLDEIMHIISQCHYITVSDLAQRLFASQATVRRDIAILEKGGLVTKGYGGVSLASGNNHVIELAQREIKNHGEKTHIARMAASLVHPGDAIFMDASSTVISMIPFLQQKNLTVITNSLRVAERMGQSGARVYTTGGLLLDSSKAFGGSMAERAVRSFHADKLFFSTAGVSEDGVMSDYSEMEAQLRQVMISCSSQQYYLCDSSKYAKSYLFRVESIEHVTHMLSDKPLTFPNGLRAIADFQEMPESL